MKQSTEDLTFDEDELPRSTRVLPLPRRWKLTSQESKDAHEAWLMMQAEELRPFMDLKEVREGYRAFLKFGNWIRHAPAMGEAAGSNAWDTWDFDRVMAKHRVHDDSAED